MATANIALLYLARLNEGFHHFEAFADSYRKHPPGIDCDLIIVCKGFSKPGEYAAIEAIFTGLHPKIVSVPDDIGFDVHAYVETAQKLDNEIICCLNTFTILRSDNWLAKLWNNLSKPGIGMVGATGSFESLHSSWKLIQFVQWASRQPFARFDRKLVDDFAWLVNGSAPHSIRAANSWKARIRRALGDFVHGRRPIEELQPALHSNWSALIGRGSTFQEFRDIPHFPNPHLRSNVFMMRRADLLSVPIEGPGKLACCRFESGPDGLSMSMLKRGLDLLVVGANGTGYRMEDWPSCGAFRSSNQSNLLAEDNQTRAFTDYSENVKRTHQLMTWGGYSSNFEKDVELYGVSFGQRSSIAERIELLKPIPSSTRGWRLISIAIPTHNRLSLVLDAIKTVRNQNYQKWEICVFDNASDVPIAAAIAALGDSRIRCMRSDEFLPVTESWNSAIDMTTGAYVTMIGDDDGLAPGFFERINFLVDHFESPDCIFSNLFQFMHPGVVPGHREGYVADLQMADFFEDRDTPFVLSPEEVRRSVDNSLAVKRSFMFNMPAFCCSRDLINRMRIQGKVLHSPFPDYYFANLALFLANKVVAEPRPLAFQGVSKVSFGFTMINAKVDDGFKVLNHDVANDSVYTDVAKHLLPGSRYQSEYIVTMAYVAWALYSRVRQPDFERYRMIQIAEYLKSDASRLGFPKTAKGRSIWTRLSGREKRLAIKAKLVRRAASRLPRLFGPASARFNRETSAYLFQAKQVIFSRGDYTSLSEIFADQQSGAFFELEKHPEKRKTRPRRTKPSANIIPLKKRRV